jgi:hypothetical protein
VRDVVERLESAATAIRGVGLANLALLLAACDNHGKSKRLGGSKR